MKGTYEALASYEKNAEFGHWTFPFGDGYELSFEPLHSGVMYVALYQHGDLMAEKVAMAAVRVGTDL